MIGLLLCVAATVVDGDTIRCDGVGRVRMVAIDTPDKVTSSVCRRRVGNHVCDTAASNRATAQLRLFMAGKRVTYRVISRDRYGRVVGQVFAGGNDLQCLQLRTGVARYMPRYDTRKVIRNRCPMVVRQAAR